MRTALMGATAILGASLLAAPAFADVEVVATIDKFKDKDITETILKDKAAFIHVQVQPDVGKFSESDLQVNQLNVANTLEEVETKRTDTILGSATGNNGVLSVNQASGNLNNQGNAVSAAVTTGDGLPVFAEAQANVEQDSTLSPLVSIQVAERDALIDNSINANTGVTHVNQSPGTFNNQANALSMAVSLGEGGVVLTEADLGQANTENLVTEFNATRTAILTASLVGNSGITGVNQASGNYANQANVVAFGVATIQ